MLGVNAAHDAAACVISGGRLRIAIAEERLTRRKHQAGSPRRAIDYCLKGAGLAGLEEVDCVAINEFPPVDLPGDLRRQGYRGELLINPSHHLLHAHYAAAACGRPDTAILVVDGSGYPFAEHSRHDSPLLGPPPRFADMWESESSFALRSGKLDLVERRWGLWDAQSPFLRFPSLGHMFSMASQYIFSQWVDAGKTMGLAPLGDAAGVPGEIVSLAGEEMTVDTEWVLRLPRRSDRPAHLDQTCRDVAAKVQSELERAMLWLAGRLHEKTGLAHLCISGGVALNSVANARLRRDSPFEGMFVTPAAGDSGVAIGAAIYGHAELTGELPLWSAYSDFLGASYAIDDVERATDGVGARARLSRTPNPAAIAAEDIADGRVIGWVEGRSELGPRALGHRSILCDPRVESIRDHLNEHVKFREPFRPYAAAVLEEHAGEYFEVEWIDRFMLSVVQIRPQYRERLPSICHVDGSCRVQTVPPGSDGFRRLLEAFFEATGLPLVLNTSLNVRGEPMVETPEDAIRCFLGTNIDLLYLDGRRIEKPTLDPRAPDLNLVPTPNDGIAIQKRVLWREAGWAEEASAARRPHERQGIALESFEASVLRRADGRASVGEIAADGEFGPPRRLAEALVSLQRKGLVSMAFARPLEAG